MPDLDILWMLVPLAFIGMIAYTEYLKHRERLERIRLGPQAGGTDSVPSEFVAFVTTGTGAGLTAVALGSLIWIHMKGVAAVTVLFGIGGLTCLGVGLGMLAYHRSVRPQS